MASVPMGSSARVEGMEGRTRLQLRLCRKVWRES